MTLRKQSGREDRQSVASRVRDSVGANFWPPAVTLIIFFIGVTVFAPQQSVWVDETTQLAGAGLPLGTLIRWLAGMETLPLGVPPDRMPPLSYGLDVIGWHLWGANELAFRYYHAVIAGAGIAVLTVSMSRRFGWAAALATGLIFALSPKVLTIAVEIRAYPVFLAISCAQTAMIVRGGIAERPWRLVLFLLLGLCGIYTHFFGIVAASAYFVAVAATAQDRSAFWRVAAAYGLLLLLCLGLRPFISGAQAISNSTAPAMVTLTELAGFPIKLVGNTELLIKPLMAILYLGGVAAALAILTADLSSRARRERLELCRDPRFSLALALFAGVGVCMLASVVLRGFNPLGARYGIWTFPPLAALIGITLLPRAEDKSAGLGAARWLSLAALAAGALWSAMFFIQQTALFTHGPNRDLEAVLARTEGPTAVLHVGPGWAWAYFPLRWHHGEELPQWLLDPSGSRVVRIGSGGNVDGPPHTLSVLAGYHSLVIARVDMNNYRGLRQLVSSRDVATRAARTLAALPAPLHGRNPTDVAFTAGAFALAARVDVAANISLPGPQTTADHAMQPEITQ